jgi:N-acetylmuramoyl-L-alanine amidase
MEWKLKNILLSVWLLMSLCFCFNSKANAVNDFLIKQILPDQAGKLVMISGEGNPAFSYKYFKIANPSRLVIDVNNAVLVGQKRNIETNNSDIKDFRISQFTTEPSVVRMVVTTDSIESLKKIKVSRTKNAIMFDLNELTPSNIVENPLYKDKDFPLDNSDTSSQAETININFNAQNYDKEAIIKTLQNKIDHNVVLKKISTDENRMILSGTGIFSVANPITLENPKRIVFDIPDGIIDSPTLLQPIALKNGDTARLGQFDNTTVRLVIETQTPEIYKSIISPDMQSVMISPKSEISIEGFPDSTASSEVQNLKIVKKDPKTTQITLVSTKPLIHRLERSDSPNKLALEFYNLKKPSTETISALSRTGQFHGIEFDTVDKFVNGSKWVLPLNRSTRVESKLSIDGRMMEIILKDIIPPAAAAPKPKAKPHKSTKGQIVIDAGHGGAEPGALRAGIYEKNITIEIARKVKRNLERAGISVVMTREADESVSLKERTVITNTVMPDAFVSIHVNSSESSQPNGLETYYYTPQSKELAQDVHKKLNAYISAPDRGIRTARFYVIRNTEVPAILTEIGYISNNGERAELLTESRQDATAKAIAEGIINFLRDK